MISNFVLAVGVHKQATIDDDYSKLNRSALYLYCSLENNLRILKS